MRWEREGGEGLPPAGHERDRDRDAELGDQVQLFTCVHCGFRAADPPAPFAGCCGFGDVVCHWFDRDEYERIRRRGER